MPAIFNSNPTPRTITTKEQRDFSSCSFRRECANERENEAEGDVRGRQRTVSCCAPVEGVAFTIDDFNAALDKYDLYSEIDANGALVDITAKSSAYASIHSLKHVAEAGIVSGFHEEFVIIGENEVDDSLIFQYDLAWERCRQLQAEDVVLKRKAVGANKGAVVSWRVSVKSTAEELLERNLWRLMGKHID